MIMYVTFLFYFVITCNARPEVDVKPQNVVTVPPNCPDGQSWVNGECRDVWRVTAAPSNVVTVPPNCPPGQVYINGQCRDVWFKFISEESILGDKQSNYDETAPQNVVTVPPNCLPNQHWINGACVDVWSLSSDNKNVISVPTNCPSGQEYINGQCREVWRSSPNLIENYMNKLKEFLTRNERQVQNLQELADREDAPKNVISVPNQCPAGYRPDALGVCREIFDN